MIVSDFFGMLGKPDVSTTKSRRVFVFPIFEVEGDQKVPDTKPELLEMLKNKKAATFHLKLCAACHTPPKLKVRLMSIKAKSS